MRAQSDCTKEAVTDLYVGFDYETRDDFKCSGTEVFTQVFDDIYSCVDVVKGLEKIEIDSFNDNLGKCSVEMWPMQ